MHASCTATVSIYQRVDCHDYDMDNCAHPRTLAPTTHIRRSRPPLPYCTTGGTGVWVSEYPASVCRLYCCRVRPPLANDVVATLVAKHTHQAHSRTTCSPRLLPDMRTEAHTGTRLVPLAAPRDAAPRVHAAPRVYAAGSVRLPVHLQGPAPRLEPAKQRQRPSCCMRRRSSSRFVP